MDKKKIVKNSVKSVKPSENMETSQPLNKIKNLPKAVDSALSVKRFDKLSHKMPANLSHKMPANLSHKMPANVTKAESPMRIVGNDIQNVTSKIKNKLSGFFQKASANGGSLTSQDEDDYNPNAFHSNEPKPYMPKELKSK